MDLPGDVTLREAEVGDLGAFKAAFDEVAAEGRWIGTEAPVDWAVREPRFRASIESLDVFVLLALDAERVVAWCVGELHAGIVDVGMGIVDGYRSQGLGTKLLAAVIGWAGHRDAHKLYLEVWPTNERAIGLYEKFGFEHEGRRVRQYRRNDGSLWDSLAMGLVLDVDSPGGPPSGR